MHGAALSSQNSPPVLLQPSLQDVAVHQELSAHTAGNEQQQSLLQGTQRWKVMGRGGAVG